MKLFNFYKMYVSYVPKLQFPITDSLSRSIIISSIFSLESVLTLLSDNFFDIERSLLGLFLSGPHRPIKSGTGDSRYSRC